MIRVMIADDVEITLDGMRRNIEQQPDMEIVCEGTTKLNTIERALEHRPDVLLLDVSWFGDEGAGIEVIRRLRQDLPETQIVAITVYPHLVERAKAAGARSAVNKGIPRKQLIEEIRGVHHLPPSQADAAPAVAEKPDDVVEHLTPREREVLACVADGDTDPMIGEKLGIRRSTARNHVNHILQKLNAPNRAAAVMKAYRLGLLGGDEG